MKLKRKSKFFHNVYQIIIFICFLKSIHSVYCLFICLYPQKKIIFFISIFIFVTRLQNVLHYGSQDFATLTMQQPQKSCMLQKSLQRQPPASIFELIKCNIISSSCHHLLTNYYYFFINFLFSFSLILFIFIYLFIYFYFWRRRRVVEGVCVLFSVVL